MMPERKNKKHVAESKKRVTIKKVDSFWCLLGKRSKKLQVIKGVGGVKVKVCLWTVHGLKPGFLSACTAGHLHRSVIRFLTYQVHAMQRMSGLCFIVVRRLY